jgi:hypothetical protein
MTTDVTKAAKPDISENERQVVHKKASYGWRQATPALSHLTPFETAEAVLLFDPTGNV